MRFTDSVLISMTCPMCGKQHKVEVSESAYYQWEDGALIQNVMPTLSSTEREQLMSHLCPECQIKLFGEHDFDIEEVEDEGDDISACMWDSLEFTGQWW